MMASRTATFRLVAEPGPVREVEVMLARKKANALVTRRGFANPVLGN
jgi:hypothetical protein